MSIVSAETPQSILIFNYEYPPLGGGAANATEHLLREFTLRSDIEVDLVTSAGDNVQKSEALSSQVRIHYLAIGDKKHSLHHQSKKDLLVYSWKAYWFGRNLMRQKQFHGIHAFFGVPSGFVAGLLSAEFTVPYLVSLRGSDVPGYSERFKNLYPILAPFIKRVWKRATFVVTNSEGLKKLALETAPTQLIEVIPNGVDTDHFQPAAQKNGQNFVITTGATRITKRKGLVYLLEAVNNLRYRYPEIRVEIMGDGGERENLLSFVQDNHLEEQVKFFGRIPKENTLAYYQQADVFILPSFNEGMSNALLEALATGLPAIVTDTGGSHELVTEGVNGLYIEKKSAKSIEIALEQFLENRVLLSSFGLESRKRALELNWQQVAQSYLSLYQKLS